LGKGAKIINVEVRVSKWWGAGKAHGGASGQAGFVRVGRSTQKDAAGSGWHGWGRRGGSIEVMGWRVPFGSNGGVGHVGNGFGGGAKVGGALSPAHR
jgi:hypothetical protein